MKHIKPTKMLPAAMLALGLMGCGGASKSNTEELPSFDDLVGYLEDGTFTERYIPKPHKVANFIFVRSTYLRTSVSSSASNAQEEFARFLHLNSDINLSGITLLTDNFGGIPYEERSRDEHPSTYHGHYFKYVCPISSVRCAFNAQNVQRITPREWRAFLRKKGSSTSEIQIPVITQSLENDPVFQ